MEQAARFGPRERIQLLGEARLSDVECLALVLRCGQRGESAEQMAQRLLGHFGSLSRLAAAALREVAAVPGVGPVRAASVRAAFGLARRVTESRHRPGTAIRGSDDVARWILESTRDARREGFFTVLLDARHRVLGLRVVSLGSLNSAPVHPREVFAPAIREGAAALILAHNHPSGDATPSEEDRRVTRRLTEVGELHGIQVLDHVVVGGDRYFSFADDRHRPIAGLACGDGVLFSP